jgi:tetratricopeptide (TPR) repeat protein
MLNQALAYNLAGQSNRVIPLAEAAQSIFDRLGEPWGRAVAAQNLAEAYQALGDMENAEHFAWKVVEQEERATLPDGLRVLGEIQLARGEPQRALTFLEQSAREARENQDRFLEGYAWRSIARAHCTLGDLEQAVSAITRTITLFQELDLAHEVEKSRGISQEIMNLADATIARCKEEHNRACEAGTLRAVGRLLVALGANDEAREALGQAVALYEELDLKDEVARTKKLHSPGLP